MTADRTRQELAAALAGMEVRVNANRPGEIVAYWSGRLEDDAGRVAAVIAPVVERLQRQAAAEAYAAVLHWLAEDTDWARETSLGPDVALGIDHARRRVIEMAAGRWPSDRADGIEAT